MDGEWRPLEETARAPLRLALLGPFGASLRERPLAGLQERQGDRLLAYLALRQGRSVPSTALAGVFWPETQSLDSLRQALTTLRRALGDQADRLETARGVVSLNLEGAWVDALAFDAAIARGEPCSLRSALALYAGPLLEGWDERWLEKEREKRREAYVEALHAVAADAIRQADHPLAVSCLQRYIRFRPAAERAWGELMQALLASGERIAALDLYHRYREYLNRHYQVSPPAAMTRLYQEIRDHTAHEPAIGQPADGLVPDASITYETIGGAMPLRSPFYIARAADAKFQAALARQDSLVLVKGPSQTGKSSLLARGLHVARQRGAAVAATNIETFAAADRHSMDALCQRLAQSLASDLDVGFVAARDWNPLVSPNVNLERFLHRRVLAQTAAPLVWGLDGLDSLFACSYSGEFFSMLRSWHEKRSFEPTRPWTRLTLALVYATEAHLYVKDLNKSPFNVGTRLALEDFSFAQVEELNGFYGTLLDSAQLPRLFDLLGGHPYLLRRGLQELAQAPADARDLEAFTAQALRGDGPFGDHLRRVGRLVREDAALQHAIAAVLAQGACAEESFFRLHSGGILSGPAPERAVLRCRLYHAYLARQLA